MHFKLFFLQNRYCCVNASCHSFSAHFKLKFKTSSSAGILYYAEGLYHPERVYDYEGLFLKDGYLYYFLFNPAPYSIGSSFGFRGKSNITLNDGNWHEVCSTDGSLILLFQCNFVFPISTLQPANRF